MSTGSVAFALGLALAGEKNAILFFHTLAGAASQQAVNLQLAIPGKGNHAGFEQFMKIMVANIPMENHAAS